MDENKTDEINIIPTTIATEEQRNSFVKFEDVGGNSESYITKNEKNKSKNLGMKILALIATIGVSISGCSFIKEMERGSENPKKYGELDPSVIQVLIEDGANLRFDPYYASDGSNLIEQNIGGSVTVETPNGAYLTNQDEYSRDGTWVGVSVEDIKNAMPNFDDKNDKDGWVWINEQKSKVIKENK
jgi:hypothetical protein